MSYSSYKLTESGRAHILAMFQNLHQRYDIIKGDHITHMFPSSELPPTLEKVVVYGIFKTDDIIGVCVEVNGNSQRPDGKLYHITVAHTNKVKPVHSNVVLSENPSRIMPLHRVMVIPTHMFNGVVEK